MNKIIYTDAAALPIGPYSQAVLANGTLYSSGQIAADCLDGDIAAQTDAVCKSIAAILQAANMELSDVAKTTCFLTDIDYFTAFNEVYGEYFAHKPARSTVAVKDLPKGALVEIEVVAVANKTAAFL